MKTDRRGTLAALALCTLLPSLGTSIANVALPTLAGAFDASFREVQWVVLAYLLANTAAIAGVGRLGDIVGRRRLLVHGLAIFAGASLACALAPALWLLDAARGVQGLGAAILMALSLAFASESVPNERGGRTMGFLGSMSAIGTALGPTLGGLLIAAFGWRSIFLVNLPLALAAWLLVDRHLAPEERQSPAPAGGALAKGTLVMQVTLAAFGGMRDPALRIPLATTGIVAAVMMATLVVGPFYLAGSLGLATATVGLVMSAGPIVAALAGVPSGFLVDRLGSRRTTAYALGGMALGAASLSVVPAAWGIGGYVAPLAILTAHYALFQAANNTAVMANVPAQRRGAIAGMLNLARNLGLLSGASVLGALYSVGGMQATFAVATLLVVLAFAIGLIWKYPSPMASSR